MEENEVKRIAKKLGCEYIGVWTFDKKNKIAHHYMFGIPDLRKEHFFKIINIHEFSEQELIKKIEEVRGERW